MELTWSAADRFQRLVEQCFTLFMQRYLPKDFDNSMAILTF